MRSKRSETSRLQKHVQVLTYLATKGPASKYKIEKNIRPEIDHATLHEIVSQLKKASLIMVSGRERSRVGLTVEYYELKLLGVIAAIQGDCTLDLRKISGKYRDLLPLVFGRWESFLKSGLKPQLRLMLSCHPTFLSWSLSAWLDIILKGPGSFVDFNNIGLDDSHEIKEFFEEKVNSIRRHPEEREKTLANEIYEGFFGISFGKYTWRPPGQPRSDYLRTFSPALLEVDRVWVLDPEIRDWIVTALKRKIDIYSEPVKWYQKRLDGLLAMNPHGVGALSNRTGLD